MPYDKYGNWEEGQKNVYSIKREIPAGLIIRILAGLADIAVCILVFVGFKFSNHYLATHDLGNIVYLKSFYRMKEYLPPEVKEFYKEILAVLFLIFYAPMYESSYKEGTLGKRMFKLRVVNPDGSKISFAKALLRNFMKIISVGAGFLGVLIMVFSPKRITFHDWFCKTRVIYGR